MQHLSDWASNSLLRTIVAAPVLIPYGIYKLFQTLNQRSKT